MDGKKVALLLGKAIWVTVKFIVYVLFAFLHPVVATLSSLFCRLWRK
jgi:hypothetical protein